MLRRQLPRGRNLLILMDDRVLTTQYERYYKKIYEAQYEALGKAENFRYHIHDGGHATHAPTVIEFFKETL